MKKYLAILVVILFSLPMRAEVKPVQNFEGGIHVGVGTPIGGFHGGDRAWGSSHYGLCLRYNLKKLPVDVGIFGLLDCAWYDVPVGNFKRQQQNRTWVIGVEGNYNLRRGTLFNPYAGMGLGMAFNRANDQYYVHSTSPAILPHIGLELLYHIRIEAGMQLSRKGFNVFQLSLGLTIGGRPKKTK